MAGLRMNDRGSVAALARRREHGWVHKLRLVFYEAEKIKRFDWLIYPSRLLLSSILREPALDLNSFLKGHESFDFFFFPSLAWV